MTQAQWQAVMGNNPSHFSGKANNPVESVGWHDCQEFIQRLNGMGFGTFSLPTEAEWEYACRAETTTRFSFGDALECADTGEVYCESADQYMWWLGNNTYGDNVDGTKEVGLKLPNPWGLYDMHGNVCEFCRERRQNIYGEYFPLRGGGWFDNLRYCRSASRDYDYMPFGSRDYWGFRVMSVASPISTPTVVPTPSPTPVEFTGETITIPFDLPDGAKPLEMVLIPAGTFMMGSPSDERGRSSDETQHQVTISQNFYLGKYEVTQAQWELIMGNNPSYYSDNPNRPVGKVSWNDCQQFMEQLNTMGFGIFRLPTEAEWEYACRAGTTTRFSFGDALECADSGEVYCELADQYMWWWGNNEYGNHVDGTKEVGLKLPNPWGLHDMHGNASEWCSDWYQRYDKGDQIDPMGPESGLGRVKRGGSYVRSLQNCRSADRSDELPGNGFDYIGVRLVLVESSWTPSSSPTPNTATPIPTSTPTVIPTPTPTAVNFTGETITIPLDLPDDATPLEMVLIPAGTFIMGSPSDERGRRPEEWLPHTVTLTKDFYIGKYEVTKAQYEAVIGINPSDPGRQDYPLMVSWYDCAKFCNRLSEMKGQTPVYDESNWTANRSANGYRLPTEAEWEYACRAGTTTRFSFGDALECSDTVFYCELADRYMWWYGGNASGIKEVGLKLPNPWGLYDMHGNAREWCSDRWQDPYERGDQVDPIGPESGLDMVLRNGTWESSLRYCRSAYRAKTTGVFKNGFRVSRTP